MNTFCTTITARSIGTDDEYDNVDKGPGEAAVPFAARSFSARDERRDERMVRPPPLRSARGELRGERNENEAEGRPLRQTEPLIKPEMLDRLLQPGPRLVRNIRYVKAEMERYADRLIIEKRNALDTERVSFFLFTVKCT